MWSDYFQNGKIVGCDISRESFITAPRVECRHLDQSSRDALSELKAAYPTGFDIILDDGSHIVSHQHITLGALFPLVRPGGLFVVEDIHTSVGRSEKCFDVYGLDRDMGNSTYRLLKKIQEKAPFSSRHMTDEEVEYIASYVDFCEIYEAKNWSVTSILRKKA
jgi:predicted O-methyltransferase YrrM